ncbi:aldo/keto reductase [Zavarzinia sp.]|uniref:aldo/keto reductase n=1 Tax=Zavarzinia sp. TaxID=2027920 RepID=UPI003569E699
MDYVTLGRSGLKVSRLCLGCLTYAPPERGSHPWTLNEEQSRPFIQKALELGINFFDTANAYSGGASEEVLGRALKDFAKREDVVIGSKVYFPMSNSPTSGGLSRKAILAEVDASLRRLGTDYIDLYQMHRFDYGTPIEETLRTFDDLVTAGKIRYFGASSMYAWQFGKLIATAERNGWVRPISMQSHMNLLYREEEREMVGLCKAEGIGMTPWSPLARGRLTRPWQASTMRAETDQYTRKLYAQTEAADQKVVEAVCAIAEVRGVPPAQVALAWLLAKEPVASPIVGATKPHHLDDAVAALSIRLDAAEIAALEAPYVPHPVVEFN